MSHIFSWTEIEYISELPKQYRIAAIKAQTKDKLCVHGDKYMNSPTYRLYLWNHIKSISSLTISSKIDQYFFNSIRRGTVKELVLFGATNFIPWLKNQTKPFASIQKLQIIGLKTPSIANQVNDSQNYYLNIQKIRKIFPNLVNFHLVSDYISNEIKQYTNESVKLEPCKYLCRVDWINKLQRDYGCSLQDIITSDNKTLAHIIFKYDYSPFSATQSLLNTEGFNITKDHLEERLCNSDVELNKDFFEFCTSKRIKLMDYYDYVHPSLRVKLRYCLNVKGKKRSMKEADDFKTNSKKLKTR